MRKRGTIGLLRLGIGPKQSESFVEFEYGANLEHFQGTRSAGGWVYKILIPDKHLKLIADPCECHQSPARRVSVGG